MDEPRDCHTRLLIHAEMSRERRRVGREVRIIIPRSTGPEFLATSFLGGRGHPASGPTKAVVSWTTGGARPVTQRFLGWSTIKNIDTC